MHKKAAWGRDPAKRWLIVRHRIGNDICMTRRRSEREDRGLGCESFHELIGRIAALETDTSYIK